MGDPGLFGDIWSGIKKVGGAALGATTGFLTGGIGGATRGAVSGWSMFNQRQAGSSATPQLPPMLNPRLGTPGFVQAQNGVRGPTVPTPGPVGWMQRAVPGGATGYEFAGPPPSGYRLNKSSYFLKDGTFVPAGTRYVKIRRRNPNNPRALSRAISRVESAKRAQKRLSRITVRKPAKCR